MLFIRACFDLQVQGFSNTKLLILGKFINCECWGSMFSLLRAFEVADYRFH